MCELSAEKRKEMKVLTVSHTYICIYLYITEFFPLMREVTFFCFNIKYCCVKLCFTSASQCGERERKRKREREEVLNRPGFVFLSSLCVDWINPRSLFSGPAAVSSFISCCIISHYKSSTQTHKHHVPEDTGRWRRVGVWSRSQKSLPVTDLSLALSWIYLSVRWTCLRAAFVCLLFHFRFQKVSVFSGRSKEMWLDDLCFLQSGA